VIEICTYKKKWYKQLRSWLWIGGSIVVSTVAESAGQGILNYFQVSGGELCWKKLGTSVIICVLIGLANLMIHSPRHEGGNQ
jgi:hypothetical protein